jgi:hypothetical protein
MADRKIDLQVGDTLGVIKLYLVLKRVESSFHALSYVENALLRTVILSDFENSYFELF